MRALARFEVHVNEEFRGAGPETLAPYDLVVVNDYNRGAQDRWGDRANAALEMNNVVARLAGAASRAPAYVILGAIVAAPISAQVFETNARKILRLRDAARRRRGIRSQGSPVTGRSSRVD